MNDRTILRLLRVFEGGLLLFVKKVLYSVLFLIVDYIIRHNFHGRYEISSRQANFIPPVGRLVRNSAWGCSVCTFEARNSVVKSQIRVIRLAAGSMTHAGCFSSIITSNRAPEISSREKDGTETKCGQRDTIWIYVDAWKTVDSRVFLQWAAEKDTWTTWISSCRLNPVHRLRAPRMKNEKRYKCQLRGRTSD